MGRFAWIVGTCLLLAGSASAQSITTLSADDDGVTIGGAKPEEQVDTAEPRSVYEKKVGGIVWLEATAGPSQFNATRFRSLDIVPDAVSNVIPSVVVSGPELGAALLFRAGSSTIGARFKRADYDPFDLTSIGLDLGFMIRAVPYVHPTIRLAFNYYTATGGQLIPNLDGLGVTFDSARSHGGGASVGLGLRIPLVRWISIAANFDYSIIGLVFNGSAQIPGLGTTSVTAGTAGTAIAGNFALTVHLGG